VQAGAAGVLAVRFTESTVEVSNGSEAAGRELVELGATGLLVVAHQAAGTRRRDRCFTTTASPVAFAALLRGGYLPTDVVVAGLTRLRQSRYVRDDARVSTQQTNGEIAGQTQMIEAGRRAVVAELRAMAGRLGADGILVAAFTTDWSPKHRVVQISALGDAVVRLGRRTPGRTSQAMVLPLRAPGSRSGRH
jgi:uncharacterized protein YbjQ (UPF0145 family)